MCNSVKLAVPATPLVRAGYHVWIIDQFADPQWKTKSVAALDKNPLCFGVSSMTGPQILHALNVCKLAKTRCPDMPIIWGGGIHASILSEQTLENDYIDIVVVVGEGEITLIGLVKALEHRSFLSTVKGIAYRENGKYRFTGFRPFVDLKKQMPLAYQLVDMDHYRESLLGVDHIHLNCSRGCVLQCAFCWDPVIHK